MLPGCGTPHPTRSHRDFRNREAARMASPQPGGVCRPRFWNQGKASGQPPGPAAAQGGRGALRDQCAHAGTAVEAAGVPPPFPDRRPGVGADRSGSRRTGRTPAAPGLARADSLAGRRSVRFACPVLPLLSLARTPGRRSVRPPAKIPVRIVRGKVSGLEVASGQKKTTFGE